MKFLKTTAILSACALASSIAPCVEAYKIPNQPKKDSLRLAASSRALSSTKISYSDAQNYINSLNGVLVSSTTDQTYKYVKYELKDTIYLAEQRFLDLEFYHDPSIAETTISIDKMKMESYSYATGFGFIAETEMPGFYASVATEFSTTVEAQGSLHYTLNLSLKANENHNSSGDAKGWYYLYMLIYKSDSIIIKTRRDNGAFVSATYFSNVTSNRNDFKLLQKRPVINKPVDPTC